MIAAKCDGCSTGFKLPDHTAGKKGKCPNCGSVVVVPSPPQAGNSSTELIATAPVSSLAVNHSKRLEKQKETSKKRTFFICTFLAGVVLGVVSNILIPNRSGTDRSELTSLKQELVEVTTDRDRLLSDLNSVTTANVEDSTLASELADARLQIRNLESQVKNFNSPSRENAGPTRARKSLGAPHLITPEQVLTSYLQAPNWRSRLPFVLESQKVAQAMESRYGPAKLSPDFEILRVRQPGEGGRAWFTIEVEVDSRVSEYYLENTPDGYRVDWESSVGANRISIAELHATTPTDPVQLYVLISLDDYYNYEFRDTQQTHWSFQLEASNGARIGNGYVRKESATGQLLFDHLRDGRQRRGIVSICYLPRTQDTSVFELVAVAALDTWKLSSQDVP